MVGRQDGTDSCTRIYRTTHFSVSSLRSGQLDPSFNASVGPLFKKQNKNKTVSYKNETKFKKGTHYLFRGGGQV